MNKQDFVTLAEAASRKGMNDLPYTARNRAMARQLGIRSEYDLPSLDEFAPTAFYTGYKTGGVGGGNCWTRANADGRYAADNREANQFESLDNFLDEHFPSISRPTVRALERAVKDDSFTDPEYYGNETDYVVRSLDFDDMCKILQDAGLVIYF